MSTKISHSGIIESIDDGCIHVRIVQTSACAACKVAGYCHAAESKEKIVDVFKPAGSLKVGDAVTVISGVWEGTAGVIKSINEGKQSVTIHVDMFGRPTPVELAFTEVKRL